MNYGYSRVSTDKQTVENQRFEIENYCVKNGIKIDKWIHETISGKEPFEKRKLGRLLKATKKGDVLVCSELSRLSRTMYSLILILDKCEKQEISIIAIKENFNPEQNSMSRYIAPIFAVVSEIERNLISQRTKEALLRLKASGMKLGRPVGSKSKRKKLSGKEKTVEKMMREKISLREMAKKLKVHCKTLKSFLLENGLRQ
jgi:DNA invertase Pin-like site-specific DNA recombinase